MPITVQIVNNEEWNVVQPVAEMMGGPKPRCLSPGLKFKIFGLEDLKVYSVGMVFYRSVDKYTFSKDQNCWVQWKTGIEEFPEQRVTMEAAIGGDLGIVDFSKITMTTNEKLPTKEDQIIVQTHHIYSAMMWITELESQETMHFSDQRLQFVVVTNTNPRVKAQKQLLDAIQEPEKMVKKAKKEKVEKKRAEKKLKRPAPEQENKYQHLIGTEEFERMRPRFIIRRDPPAEPPAKRQRVEKEGRVVQQAPQPVYSVVNEPEIVTTNFFYNPSQSQLVDQASSSESGNQSPWNQDTENVPPAENQQYGLLPIGQLEEKDAEEEEEEFAPICPSQIDLSSGGFVKDTSSAYSGGDFAEENWRDWFI